MDTTEQHPADRAAGHRRHRSVGLQDLALALAATVPDVFYFGNPAFPGTSWAEHAQVLALACVQAVALALRRRRPMAVFLVVWAVTTGACLLTLADALSFTPFFGLLLALYTVADTCRRPAAFTALALGLAATGLKTYYLVDLVPTTDSTSMLLSSLAFYVLVTVSAWSLARWVRAGRIAAERDRRDLTEARRAVVRERTRIARELHDIVANAVAVMVMRAENARSTTPAEQTGTIEAFGHIEDVGRSAMTELRRMLRVLRSPDAPVEDIGRHGLADLQPMLEDGRRTGIRIDLDVRGTPLPLDDSVDRTAYRLVQEAVTNITKHAGPGSHAAVRITWSDALHIEVVDDGAGRTLALRRDLSTGHGLIGLAERIAVFGGELTAGPHRAGFRVAATLPLSPTPAAGAPAPAVTGGGLRRRGGL